MLEMELGMFGIKRGLVLVKVNGNGLLLFNSMMLWLNSMIHCIRKCMKEAEQ